MLAIARLIFVLLLPLAGCAVLAAKGSHAGIGWALLIVVAIFIYHYLQAALIVTEKKVKRGLKERLFGIGPVVLVGLSASFVWQDWIVEQMFLEAGAFSLGVAFIAVGKGIREGSHAPWAAIVVVFLAPALTLVFLAGRTIFKTSDASFMSRSTVFRVVALVAAVVDTVHRLHPYVLGGEQLDEPFQRSWQMVFAVVWMIGLLVGLPLLLMPPGR